jgi:hypothetical protein
MRDSLRQICASWVKAKSGQIDWPKHAETFLEGARAAAQACNNQPLADDLTAMLQGGPNLDFLITVGRRWAEEHTDR